MLTVYILQKYCKTINVECNQIINTLRVWKLFGWLLKKHNFECLDLAKYNLGIQVNANSTRNII